jgi:dUTP pyrophosphatase
MKIKLDDGAIMPTRAYPTDAGLDLYAMETQIVPAKDSAVFDTGVHIELPTIYLSTGMFPGLFNVAFNTVGFLKSKSGLNVKHGITSEGVIDVGYTGSIKVKLYNHSGYDYKVNKGDKISQLVILPIITPGLELVEELKECGRGNNGFGSTGK